VDDTKKKLLNIIFARAPSIYFNDWASVPGLCAGKQRDLILAAHYCLWLIGRTKKHNGVDFNKLATSNFAPSVKFSIKIRHLESSQDVDWIKIWNATKYDARFSFGTHKYVRVNWRFPLSSFCTLELSAHRIYRPWKFLLFTHLFVSKPRLW
jgi:hypothetical protein